MRFLGVDADIDVGTEHPEFSAWKWVPVERLPELIVSFKCKLYVDLLRELGRPGPLWVYVGQIFRTSRPVPYSSVVPPYGLTLSVGPLYEKWA